MSPTTIPLTPPAGCRSAVICPNLTASATGLGISPNDIDCFSFPKKSDLCVRSLREGISLAFSSLVIHSVHNSIHRLSAKATNTSRNLFFEINHPLACATTALGRKKRASTLANCLSTLRPNRQCLTSFIAILNVVQFMNLGGTFMTTASPCENFSQIDAVQTLECPPHGGDAGWHGVQFNF